MSGMRLFAHQECATTRARWASETALRKAVLVCFDQVFGRGTFLDVAMPTTPTSVDSTIYSTATYLPSAGEYTIPVTTTCSPAGPDFTKPVTKTFEIYTSVSEAQTCEITKTLTITYTGEPAPTASSSSTELPLSTSTYCTKNGVHTIPIVATVTPANPAYSTAVTTTVYYTTTVTNAPVAVSTFGSILIRKRAN